MNIELFEGEDFLIFSDLHAHPHSQNWDRVDHVLEVLEWIKKICVEKKISTIIFLGDFFHIKDKLLSRVVAKVFPKIVELKDAGIKIIMLVGNHDQPKKDSSEENSLILFSESATIVDSPTHLKGKNKLNIFLIPHIENYETLIEAVEEIKPFREDNKINLLLGHFNIISGKLNEFKQEDKGLDPSELSKDWDYVISGHFHAYQKIRNNVWYVGSPLQINFGEIEQNKGVITYQNNQFNFIENTFSPKFIDVNEENFTPELVRNNYCRMYVPSMEKANELREKIEAAEAAGIDVRINIQEGTEIFTRNWDNKRDILTLAKEWVEKSDVDLDKSKLIELGSDIIKIVRSNEA